MYITFYENLNANGVCIHLIFTSCERERRIYTPVLRSGKLSGHMPLVPPLPSSYAYETHISISNYVGMLTTELTPNDSVIPQPN